MVMGIFAMVTLLYSGSSTELISQIVIYNVGFFFCCMVCHGELYRLRPHPEHLTSYYLATSAGGAMGGLFVALIAPLIFPLYFEFHIAIFLCCALPLLVMAEEQVRQQQAKNLWLIRSLFIVVLTLLAGRLLNHAFQLSTDKTVVSRNFYGVLRVEERSLENPELARRMLRHGSIDHGYQFLAKDKEALPTAYYGMDSGIAAAFSLTQSVPNRKIGIVGLGVGTLLTYSRAMDSIRLYEINPTVVRLAQDYFTYIERSKAEKTIIVGDARLELEREAPHRFDLFVLDAFSGDAIPMHLLTIQAIQLYLRHLEPSGILAVNISNHHLDLSPVIRALAESAGLHYVIVHQNPSEDGITEYASNWALLSRSPERLESLRNRTRIEPQTTVLWTDDFSNLFRVMR
jgi:spermidine synthase